MNTLSVNYDLKWRHKAHNQYQWTKCGKCFNLQTGRKIKKTVNGRSVGYWIAGNFYTITTLKKQIEKIPVKEYNPFD
jgi:hypothetical protein